MHEWYHRIWLLSVRRGACHTRNSPQWNTIAFWPPNPQLIGSLCVNNSRLLRQIAKLIEFIVHSLKVATSPCQPLPSLNGDSSALFSFFTKLTWKYESGICYTCSRWLISGSIYRDLSATDSCHCLIWCLFCWSHWTAYTYTPNWLHSQCWRFFRHFFHRIRNDNQIVYSFLFLWRIADFGCLDLHTW